MTLFDAYQLLFSEIAATGIKGTVALAPLSMGVFSYPHREGARKTMEIILSVLDGEEDPGIERMLIVTNDNNFVSNRRQFIAKQKISFQYRYDSPILSRSPVTNLAHAESRTRVTRLGTSYHNH